MKNAAVGPVYQELNEQTMDVLMFHLLRCPDIIRPALSVITPELFDQFSERHYKLLWSVSSHYFQQHGTPLTGETAYAEVASRIAGSMEFDPGTVNLLDYKIQQYFKGWANAQFAVSYTHDLISSFLYHRRGMRRLREAISNPMTTPAMIKDIMKGMDNVEMARSTVIQPFLGDISSRLLLTPRIPTGIVFLDQLLGGGTRAKEAYGFIAPSGGGKTTFSNQLAIGCARQHLHIFSFSYEEPVDNDYLHPMFVCAAQIPRTTMRKYSKRSDLSEADGRALDEAQVMIGQYLHVFDFSGCGDVVAGDRGIAEFEAQLAEMANQGIMPHGIIIDWFWHMIMRWSGRENIDSNALRGYAQSKLAELKQIASKYGAWIWINQQTAAAEADKKKVGSWNSAAELKSFANNLNFCVTLGAMNMEQIAEIYSSKARGACKQKFPIQFDGEYATFRSCSDDVVYDERKKKFVNKVTENAIPSDKSVKPKSATAQNYEGELQI